MRLPRLIFFIAICGAQAACANMMASSSAPASSTEGVTLVRIGNIVGISENKELTVKFEDGKELRYAIDAPAGLRVGDKVKVSENRGRVQISRQ